MFNTTIIQQGKKEYVPYVKTVIEKKAPTDESVRLLNEMKEEALKDTMLVFKVKNTSVDATFRYVEHSGSFERKAVITFTINDKNYIKEIKIDDTLKMSATRSSIVDYLIGKWREIVNEIVLEITQDVAKSFIYQAKL